MLLLMFILLERKTSEEIETFHIELDMSFLRKRQMLDLH